MRFPQCPISFYDACRRPLAWTSPASQAISFASLIPKLANVNPLHIGEKQFVNLLGMHDGMLVDIGRIDLLHVFTQNMSCSEHTTPHSSFPNNVPDFTKETEPTEPTKVLTSALFCLCPWPCAHHPSTESLPILFSKPAQLKHASASSLTKYYQVWWSSISVSKWYRTYIYVCVCMCDINVLYT